MIKEKDTTPEQMANSIYDMIRHNLVNRPSGMYFDYNLISECTPLISLNFVHLYLMNTEYDEEKYEFWYKVKTILEDKL